MFYFATYYILHNPCDSLIHVCNIEHFGTSCFWKLNLNRSLIFNITHHQLFLDTVHLYIQSYTYMYSMHASIFGEIFPKKEKKIYFWYDVNNCFTWDWVRVWSERAEWMNLDCVC